MCAQPDRSPVITRIIVTFYNTGNSAFVICQARALLSSLQPIILLIQQCIALCIRLRDLALQMH